MFASSMIHISPDISITFGWHNSDLNHQIADLSIQCKGQPGPRGGAGRVVGGGADRRGLLLLRQGPGQARVRRGGEIMIMMPLAVIVIRTACRIII